jgi:hypothetical protein
VHRVISKRHTVGFKRVWMRGVSEEVPFRARFCTAGHTLTSFFLILVILPVFVLSNCQLPPRPKEDESGAKTEESGKICFRGHFISFDRARLYEASQLRSLSLSQPEKCQCHDYNRRSNFKMWNFRRAWDSGSSERWRQRGARG